LELVGVGLVVERRLQALQPLAALAVVVALLLNVLCMRQRQEQLLALQSVLAALVVLAKQEQAQRETMGAQERHRRLAL
jgi:hypothetical protein